jgi:hypothetical protein
MFLITDQRLSLGLEFLNLRGTSEPKGGGIHTLVAVRVSNPQCHVAVGVQISELPGQNGDCLASLHKSSPAGFPGTEVINKRLTPQA